jgi:hypothetical protein
MKSWQTWQLSEWNDRLVDHFFLKTPDTGDLPVVALLVTSEELAVATGDFEANPKAVRDMLINEILEDLPTGDDLFNHAMDLPCNTDFADVKPAFFAHLIFSCIAAAESSEDLGDEGSYRKRLKHLAGDQSVTDHLGFLPPLWKKLQKWLNSPENHRRYRQLILPDEVGSHRLIGYSERLAFPDRKDQHELSTLLRQNGFAGEIPPPGQVLSLVGKNTSLFKKEFLSAFRDFRDQYQQNSSPENKILRGHRFWSAVVEATLRGRDPEDRVSARNPIDLVVCFDGEDLEMLLLAARANVKLQPGWEISELESPLAEWKYQVIDSATQTCHSIIKNLLSGQIEIGRLTSSVNQGFTPLSPVIFEYMGVATTTEGLRNAGHALVRDDLVTSIISTFGGEKVSCEPPATGWSFVEGLKIHTLGNEELVTSPLGNVWALHPNFITPKITLSEGIRSDDGWIGYAEALPRVSVPGASKVTVEIGEQSFDLTHRTDGDWALPFADINGEVTITAFDKTRIIAHKKAQFLKAPAHEEYCPPRNPYGLYIESHKGTLSFADASAELQNDGRTDFGVNCGRVILLGPGQGEFVEDESKAAWKIIRTSETKTVIALPNSLFSGNLPTVKSDIQNLRRRWRTMFAQSSAANESVELVEKLGAAKKAINAELPAVNYSAEFAPNAYSRKIEKHTVEVDPFVAAIAGRGCARAGIPLFEWRRLVANFLRLPERPQWLDLCAIESLTRCWAEANYINLVSTANWRLRLIFPQPPSLAIFRCGPIYSASLIGLALPTTIKRLKDAADKSRIDFVERRSLCKLVPPSLLFSSADLELLKHLAEQETIQWTWAETAGLNRGKNMIEEGKAPPSNYEKRRITSTWSLSGKPVGSTNLVLWGNERLPFYWATNSGSDAFWSFEKNPVRLHACKMASVSPFVKSGDHEIFAEHAYLPLPLARYSAIVSPLLPGPESLADGVSRHVYSFGTRSFRDEIFAAASTF